MNLENSTDILVFEGKDVDQANFIRGQLIGWNARDYWYYVYNDGSITVANNMGGRLSQDLVALIKAKAKEFAFNHEKNNISNVKETMIEETSKVEEDLI